MGEDFEGADIHHRETNHPPRRHRGLVAVTGLLLVLGAVRVHGGSAGLVGLAGPGEPAPAPSPSTAPPEAVDDVLTASRSVRLRAVHAPQPRVVQQSHPDLEVAEPYYGDVGETEVRAASAVTGEPLGLHLDRSDAEARIAAAEREVEVPLAVAGTEPTGRLSADLRRAGEALGVGDAAASPEAAAQLRQAVMERLAAPLRIIGTEVSTALTADVRHALALVGRDPGERVDAGDVRALEAAAALRVGPLIHASGLHPGVRVDVEDLHAMVRAVGHDPGTVADAADVAVGLARARGLAVTPPTSVSPGLDYRRVVAEQPGGAVVGHVLSWGVDDERVQLRTEHIGSFAGRVSVPAAVAARPTAVAGVNGGFWLDAADPDGLLITDGQLLSDPTALRSWVRGRRGGFAIGAAGGTVGRPVWDARVTGADAAAGSLAVRGVNRSIRDNELVLYTHHLGRSTGTPPGTIEVTVAATAPLTSSGTVSGSVAAVGANGDAPVPPGHLVLSGTGDVAHRLLVLAAGGTMNLQVEVPAGWADAHAGLTGGPVMLVGGEPTATADWRSEGFAASHTDRRHPRTVVGFDPFGQAHVLVLDGRQPGYSVGATQAEATLLARSLGMVDAVMMDGGGSSQLVLGGGLANRPCCDPTPRPVATAITFHRAR